MKKIESVYFIKDYYEGFELICTSGTPGRFNYLGKWCFRTVKGDNNECFTFTEKEIIGNQDFFSITLKPIIKNISVKISYEVTEDFESSLTTIDIEEALEDSFGYSNVTVTDISKKTNKSPRHLKSVENLD